MKSNAIKRSITVAVDFVICYLVYSVPYQHVEEFWQNAIGMTFKIGNLSQRMEKA